MFKGREALGHLAQDSGAIFNAGGEGEAYTRVFGDGAVEFTVPVISLYWKSAGGLTDAGPREIWPYALLEFPASILRLAGKIYAERAFEAQAALADLAIFGIGGWTLRPYSPLTFGYRGLSPKPFEGKEIVSAEPLSLASREIINEPDRCAFRLVQRVYEAFGLFEEDMPAEFNRDTGRLILTEE